MIFFYSGFLASSLSENGEIVCCQVSSPNSNLLLITVFKFYVGTRDTTNITFQDRPLRQDDELAVKPTFNTISLYHKRIVQNMQIFLFILKKLLT